MSRRQAREMALKSLYMAEFSADTPNEDLLTTAGEELLEEYTKDKEYLKDKEYAGLLLTGTRAKQKDIDQELGSLSKGWEVKRMAALDRNILRLAAYEMFYGEEKIPASIAINEAVELAKKYGSEESPNFVNGVLGTMVKKHGA